ncbi:MAG: efflux RND transporter periplasmic adaptor subunit [Thalassotalea sp.]
MLAKRFILFLLLSLFNFSSFATAYITVSPAKALLFSPQRTAPAIVTALNQSFIPAELAAKVIALNVTVGQPVVKGEVLAKLDCQNTQLRLQAEQAQLAQIQNQYDFNKRELTRGEPLAQQKNISAAELDSRKNQVLNSKAQVDSQTAADALAKLNVKRCTIIAPFNGTVINRIASVGDMIDFGKPVVELIENSKLEVSAKIALNDKDSFNSAKKYQLSVFNTLYPINLTYLVPLIAKNDRSQEVRFNFINAQPVAGSTGRILWAENTPYLPAHLLINRDNESGFFIAKNDKAIFIAVEQAQEGRPIPYSLAEDTQIIIEGRHNLIDGDNITIRSIPSKLTASDKTTNQDGNKP